MYLCPPVPGVFSVLPPSLRGHTYANHVLIVLPNIVLYPISILGTIIKNDNQFKGQLSISSQELWSGKSKTALVSTILKQYM